MAEVEKTPPADRTGQTDGGTSMARELQSERGRAVEREVNRGGREREKCRWKGEERRRGGGGASVIR